MIRNDADNQVKAGNYEKALDIYQKGLASHPESATLRAGEETARETIRARLLAQANAARAKGDPQGAEKVLRRILAISPNDERAKAMLLDIERDARQNESIAQAKDLIDKGQFEHAELVIGQALKENPKNQELLDLQRQQELAAKREELATTHLAETRPVSLDFRDANLRMVLEVLTRNSGINFIVDKDVRQDLQTTVFLRQTRLEDALALITATNQLAFKVLDTSTVLIYPKTPDKEKEYQDLVIRAFYLSHADAKQTAAFLKTMLKIREPYVDEKLNMLVIRETPQTIRLAERLIALQDMSEPEVMLDVEVLEVTTSRLTQLGINFPDAVSLTPITPTGGYTLGNIKSLNRDSIGVGFGGAVINLHDETGDVNILANPKIRARNHEKAKILIGDKLPVITSTASGTTGFISESVQYVDVGLKLDVEPTIYLDDQVAIKMGLEVSSLTKEISTPSGSLAYQISTRNADTLLQLRDGETQILAGLINNQERASANRLPGLGDLPLIGRLFSSHRNDGQRTEVVLSITPHIIRSIRRPDLNQLEFWSGTENNVSSRPLTLPSAKKPQEAKANMAVKSSTENASNVALPDQSAPLNPVPQSPVVLSLSAPADVRAGDIFTASVGIKTDVPVRGMPLVLDYDPKSLQAVDAEEGTFLKQDNAVVSLSKNVQQNEGRMSIGLLRNIADGAKGEGALLTLKFKALKAGDTEIRLVSANPVAARPMLPPETPKSAKVGIKP